MHVYLRYTLLISIVLIVSIGLALWNFFGYKNSQTTGIIASVSTPIILFFVTLILTWILL